MISQYGNDILMSEEEKIYLKHSEKKPLKFEKTLKSEIESTSYRYRLPRSIIFKGRFHFCDIYCLHFLLAQKRKIGRKEIF
jgi:hypothetical protein